jgi:hypothetical protein
LNALPTFAAKFKLIALDRKIRVGGQQSLGFFSYDFAEENNKGAEAFSGIISG